MLDELKRLIFDFKCIKILLTQRIDKMVNKNNPENIIDTGFVINNFIKSAEGSKLLWRNE